MAVDEKTRKLVARASSRPPPKALLLTALIVGMGRLARLCKVRRRVVRNAVTLVKVSVSLTSYNRDAIEGRHTRLGS